MRDLRSQRDAEVSEGLGKLVPRVRPWSLLERLTDSQVAAVGGGRMLRR